MADAILFLVEIGILLPLAFLIGGFIVSLIIVFIRTFTNPEAGEGRPLAIQAIRFFLFNNNRRAIFFLLVTATVFIIALYNPGDAILTNLGLEGFKQETLTQEQRKTIQSGWEYFIYGNTPPKGTSSPVNSTSWFWWETFVIYFLFSVPYGCFAIREELQDMFKGIARVVRGDAPPAQADNQRPQPNPPAAGGHNGLADRVWGTAVGEVLGEILTRLLLKKGGGK